MTKQEFTKVVKKAREWEKGRAYWDLAATTADVIHGADGKAAVEVENLAAVVRYQCLMLNGEWDAREMQTMWEWFKWKVIVV